jgi:uncharacterized membrane protein
MPKMPESTAPAPLSRHVRELSRRHQQSHEINVNDVERLASLVGGGGLVAYGLTRGTLAGMGLALIGGALAYRGATGHCACYRAMGISTARPRGRRNSVAARHGTRVDASVIVLRPREELYRYWRDLSNLPRIMHHLQSVRPIAGRRSHWVATGPLGTQVEWDAEIITERENELIGWRSVDGGDVDTAGSVHFLEAMGGRGTEIRVALKYDPPAGKLGVAVAEILGESPAEQVREDLGRFKQVMEAGTGATAAGPPEAAPGSGPS